MISVADKSSLSSACKISLGDLYSSVNKGGSDWDWTWVVLALIADLFGKYKVNTLPLFFSLVTVSSPSNKWASWREIDKPNPVPP